MKKMKTALLWIVGVCCFCAFLAIPASIPFVPYVQAVYSDGTASYSSLTYTIVVWNREVIGMDESGSFTMVPYTETSIFWLDDAKKDIEELWNMEMEKFSEEMNDALNTPTE